MNDLILMLVILNPFAQVLYLAELMNSMGYWEFTLLHLRASILSLGVFAIFVFSGELIMKEIFQVRLASLQIFGGMIMLFLAHRYITMGPGSNILFRGDIADLAQNISLPYMVGPGTIYMSIIIGKQYTSYVALGIIAMVLGVNFIFVVVYQQIYHRLRGRKETMLGKYFAILMRTNALFIGAIAVEMIVIGLEDTIRRFQGTL